jgi:hypothetical protein
MREVRAQLVQGRAAFDVPRAVGFVLEGPGVSGLYPYTVRADNGQEVDCSTPGPHFFAQDFRRLEVRSGAATGSVRLVVLEDYREWYDPTPVAAGPVAERMARFDLAGTLAPYNTAHWLPALNVGRFRRTWVQTGDLTITSESGALTSCGLRWRFVTSDGQEMLISTKYTDSTPQVAFVEFGSSANSQPLSLRGFTRIERPVRLQVGVDNALSGPTKYYYSGIIEVWGLP